MSVMARKARRGAILYKLLKLNNLAIDRRQLPPQPARRVPGKTAPLRPAHIWPAGPALAARLPTIVVSICLTSGCGHATVPCPTPTAQVDRNRVEAEQARESVARARAEERAARAVRDEAHRRASEAQAVLDSLRAAAGK